MTGGSSKRRTDDEGVNGRPNRAGRRHGTDPRDEMGPLDGSGRRDDSMPAEPDRSDAWSFEGVASDDAAPAALPTPTNEHWIRVLATIPSAPDLRLERLARAAGFRYVAGTDEAGRGCLAGPVVAAAVILPDEIEIDGLDDSKRLSAKDRAALVPLILERAVAHAVGICSAEEIDRLNILHASMEAMRRAVSALEPAADFVLVDGNRLWTRPEVPCRAIVKGDARSRSIAAASILAKTTRDRIMEDLASVCPGYGWEHNRGYPTPEHFDALVRLGVTPHHRLSFRLRVETDPSQRDLFVP